MGKLRFVLSNFWLWASLLMGCIYAQNLAIFTDKPQEGFSRTPFLMVTICCYLCLGIYFYLEHKKNKVKFDKILLPVIVGLGIIAVFTIFLQTDETYVYTNGKDTVTVAINLTARSKYAFRAIFLLAFSYAISFTMFANRTSNRSLLWLPIVLLVITYISVGYSMIAEATTIVGFFRSTKALPIKSFYMNPNAFGIGLLLGIFACFVINFYKPNAFTYLSIPFLFSVMCLTRCASTLLAGVVIVPLYFIIEIFRNIKKHPIITPVLSAIVIISGAVFSFVLFKLSDGDNRFVNNVIEIIDVFFNSLRIDSLSGRAASFEGYLRYGSDTTWHLLFGRGYGSSRDYIIGMCKAIRNGSYVLSCESGFIQVFITYGLVGLFAYIGLLGYFGYSIVKLILHKRICFALTYALCVAGLLINSLVETNIFYDMGFKETPMTLIFLLPPIVQAKFITHKEKVIETINLKVSHQFNAKRIGESIAMFFILTVAAVSAAFLSPYGMTHPTIYLIIIGGALGGLLIFPYLVTLWISTDDPVARVVNILLNFIGLFLVGFFLFAIARSRLASDVQWVALGVGGFIYILIDMVLYSIIRKDAFKSYLSITFLNPIKAMFIHLVAGFGLTVIFVLALIWTGPFAALETFGVILFAVIAFFIAVFFIPNRHTKVYMDYINEAMLSRYQKYMIRGDR